MLDYIKKHNLPGALVREFVFKELWSAALTACNNTIKDTELKLEKLKELKTMIEKENSIGQR